MGEINATALRQAFIDTALAADDALAQTIPAIAQGISYRPQVSQAVAEVLGPMELETAADVNSLLVSIALLDHRLHEQGIRYNLVGEEKKNRDTAQKLAERLRAYDPSGNAPFDLVIDPLDSTNNGLHGFPHGYMLSLLEAQTGTSPAIPRAGLEERLVKPIMALVSSRTEGELFVGDGINNRAYKILLNREGGRWSYHAACPEAPLIVGRQTEIDGISINFDDRGHYHGTRLAALQERFVQGKLLVRIFGASGYQLPKLADAHNARGLGAAVEVLTKPHDVIPPGVILTIAGGYVKRWGPEVADWAEEQRAFFRYNPTRGFEYHTSYANMNGGLIAGNRTIVDKLAAVLEK